MPQIPTYSDQLTPQGGINAAANGNDFGSQIGQTTQQLGGAIESVGESVDKVESDKARIWAYDAAGKQYTTLKQQLNDRINSLDPNDPAFTSKVANLTHDFESQVNDATQTLVNSAPNRIGARVVASHMATNGRALINMAMGEQARITGEYTGQLVQNGVKQDQDQIAADPSNDNFKRIVDSRSAMLGGLNTVDPVQKLKWQDRMTHALAITQVQSLAATSPQSFLSMVNAQGGALTRGGVKGAVPGGAGPVDVSAGARAWAAPVSTAAAAKGLDANVLLAQLDAESSGNPKAVSREGAAGISQFMPDTAKQYGVDTSDPLSSIKGQAAYMADLQTKYGGDYKKSLAAYNWGPGNLDKAIAKWGSDWASHLPAETSTYVSKVMRKAGGIPGDPNADSGGDGGNLPQVSPLDDHAIANASPDIAGWGKLTWAEKVSAVRQAESAMGSQLASERGELQRQLKDAGASLLAGKDYPGLDDQRFSQDNLMRVFGPDQGRRASDQLQYAKQVGGFIGQMATMPNAQAQAMLQTLSPEGGEEYASKAPVFKQAVEAYTRLQKLRNDDYMAWAQSQQRLNVQAVDFSSPQAFGTSLGQRIGVAEAGRTDYGADAHLLSQDEAAKLGGIITRLPPQDQMAYLKQVRQATNGHDDWFTDTLAQIAPKNSMLAVAASTATKQGRVQTAAGAQNGELVGQYILEGAHILQGKDLDDPQKSGRPLQIDDNKIRTMFWTSLGANAFASPDAQHSNQLAADTYQAVKNYLVADMYHRGMTPDKLNQDLVQNAVTAVTGGTAKQNSSTLFTPWGMAKSQFQTQFPWALDAALQKGGIKGTKLDAPDAYQYANVGDGKYLVMTGNKALVGANGRSIIVDMSRPPEGAGAGRGLVVPERGFFGGYR